MAAESALLDVAESALLIAGPAFCVSGGSGAPCSCAAKAGSTPELGGSFGTSPAAGDSALTTSAKAAPEGDRSGCGRASVEMPRVTGDEAVGSISGATGLAEPGADTCFSSLPDGT